MNFSKKNHEHKVVNLKMVSKKIILSVVFVFATVTISANVSFENDNFNLGLSETVQDEIDCNELAWEWGTEMGQGDPYLEWYYTNSMYNMCEVVNEMLKEQAQ